MRWYEDPRLSSIEHNKLELIQKVIFDIQNLKENEKLPFLLAFISSKTFRNLSFDKTENDILMDVISSYADEENLQKAKMLIQMLHK